MSANTKCPVCKKPTQDTHKPFCSDRCRQVDLGRWLKGVYVVPGRSENDPRDMDDIDK